MLSRIIRFLKNKFYFRLIIDTNPVFSGSKKIIKNKLNYKFYEKENLCRSILFNFNKSDKKYNFLDLGGRDGKLYYLLSVEKNFIVNKNYTQDKLNFYRLYKYFAIDLKGYSKNNILSGDICSLNFTKKFKSFQNKFEVIYSNNVFEHLKKPWVAAYNISKLLKKGGICITIVPFSQRYHESPVDCFRYTHKGLEYLFSNFMKFEIIAQGYDISGRRNNWNGDGHVNDYVPIDNFGAWRETWFTVFIFKKKSLIRN